MPRFLSLLVCSALLALVLSSCGRRDEPAAPQPAATRGYVLISLDTLRADHLGAYGYSRNTSPFFDRLAQEGVLFEKAIVQLPGTLPSHMSIFTSLYPAEHGVYPPSSILSPQIETLPEVFQRNGFRTAGFTEGGYMSGRYGFARGFDRFDDSILEGPDDIERTFERGLSFLRELAPSDRFFLFLHTFAVHDPYKPPPPFNTMFWQEEAPEGVFPPTGPNFKEVNLGNREVRAEEVDYFRALYDGGIRYADTILESFFQELEAIGLRDQVTVVITSDHGEEFYEHGGMVHEQAYDETLHVPLLVLHPGVEDGRRVSALTQSIDLAPTLYELARIEPGRKLSGRSLVPYFSQPDLILADSAYSEGFGNGVKSLYRRQDGKIFHFVHTSPPTHHAGFWAARRKLVFDVLKPALSFEVRSFEVPRTLTISVDGRPVRAEPLDPEWRRIHLRLPATEFQKRRIRLAADGCASPLSLGQSEDARCLSFQIRSLPLERTELFNVTRDPLEMRDVSNQLPQVHRVMYHALRGYAFEPAAPAPQRALDPELEQRLKSLGYLQ